VREGEFSARPIFILDQFFDQLGRLASLGGHALNQPFSRLQKADC